MFHATYHKRIPVDGVPLYAKQCWDQIISNKDLDLPTQQVLLAQYRCDEIAQVAMETFDAVIKPLENIVRTDAIISGLGEKMSSARGIVLTDFETQAQRYHQETFTRKLEELKSTVDLRLRVLFRAQITGLHAICAKKFEEQVEMGLKRGGEFAKTVMGVKTQVIQEFDIEAKSVVVNGTTWTFEHDRELLVQDIDGLTSRLRKDELSRIIERMEKQIKLELEGPVTLAFSQPSDKIWDVLMEEFELIKRRKVAEFVERVSVGLNASEDDVAEGVEGLKVRMWNSLRDRLDGECEPTHLHLRLREWYAAFVKPANFSFEDKFRYDEQGVPRIWKLSDDIEGMFKSARDDVSFSQNPHH